jgi:hypothetical protein
MLSAFQGRAKFNSPLRGDNRRNPLSLNAQTFEAKPSWLNQFTHSRETLPSMCFRHNISTAGVRQPDIA